jgi:hypothetical protein
VGAPASGGWAADRFDDDVGGRPDHRLCPAGGTGHRVRGGADNGTPGTGGRLAAQ